MNGSYLAAVEGMSYKEAIGFLAEALDRIVSTNGLSTRGARFEGIGVNDLLAETAEQDNPGTAPVEDPRTEAEVAEAANENLETEGGA